MEPYTHPEDKNHQIYPYKGQDRTEYSYINIHDPSPKTKQEKRKEELALGLF